tara:strand:- start:741 stop:1112 length:372 start_codon:yes stop_codon:yes gene_type:complete
MYKEKIKVGDSFLVEGGGNDLGSGTQIALVNKVTKQGNVYCYKISHSSKNLVAKKHRLDRKRIIRSFPFKLWFNNDIAAADADRLESAIGIPWLHKYVGIEIERPITIYSASLRKNSIFRSIG